MSAISWNQRVSALVRNIGASDFAETLSETIQARITFDFMVIFAYQGNKVPLDLYDNFPQDRRIIHVDDYQAGPYLLDPFYLASVETITPGLYRLKDLAPDRFYQSEYFRGYYIQTTLAEEVGFFVHLSNEIVVVVSLMRKNTVFSAREARELRGLFPIVEATCMQHWRDTSDWFTPLNGAQNSHDARENISPAFERFGEGVLTPREKEVVEYTLKGHSADATGKILNISPGTVRIHRRNIYSKLRIHSQGELFSLFISRMAEGRKGGLPK